MPASLSGTGVKKDGYIPKIPADGSSGIAGITWGGAWVKKTAAR